MILKPLMVFKYYRKLHLYLFFAALWFSVNSLAGEFFAGLISQENIIPSPTAESCTVLTPDIAYVYPPLPAGLFQASEPTVLPSISQTLQVVCSAPVDALFLTVETDPQSTGFSNNDPTFFGLGSVNQQGILGYFQVSLDSATVDGVSVLLYQTDNPTQVITPRTDVMLKPVIFQGWTLDGQTPAKGQSYSVRLTVLPTLNSLRETQGPLVNGGELNGSLVLAFPFGI